MMKYKTVLVGILFFSFSLQADVSCIGIHSTNPETFVLEQHPVDYLNCACNCSNYSWTDNGRCINCNHRHGDAHVIQTAKTNGNFVTFMPPSEAQAATPTGDTSWVTVLASKVRSKQTSSSSLGNTSFSETR